MTLKHAVVRAAHHLEKRNTKGKISLIASGGLLVSGHVPHTQSLNPLPFEPPKKIVWNQGKFKDQFEIEEEVTAAEKFLTASIENMKMALTAITKRSLKELSKKDLVSYVVMVGIPFTFELRDDKSK